MKHLPSTPGILYVVGTPIGNLEDITLRAIRVLNEAAFIAAEDTRTARKLKERFSIATPAISYYDARERSKSGKIIEKIKAGKTVALISEAGMPGVSDPGYRLIEQAIKEGITVTPVPGPSAALTALVVSGLPADRFVFEGFLPSPPTARRKKLWLLQAEERTIIFFESPRRLLAALRDIGEIFGPRRVAVARELTKKFEEVLRGTPDEVLGILTARGSVKGEIVLLVEGKKGVSPGSSLPVSEQIEQTMAELGISRMEAIKLVADRRGVAKSAIYRSYHQDK
ncbi:MAG: 16S rRNA (cytidine(1402)-2'-O)-methyltransferase [PVC group bacterium]